MIITGEYDVDLMLDTDGQPVTNAGIVGLVKNDDCWIQDLKNEAMTEEGELFYEDEKGNGSYGWSLLDFSQAEYDEFIEIEIQQRIRSKMSKRDYIDAGSIQISVEFDGHILYIIVSFKKKNEHKEYSLNIESNGVEVVVR